MHQPSVCCLEVVFSIGLTVQIACFSLFNLKTEDFTCNLTNFLSFLCAAKFLFDAKCAAN